MRVRSSGVDSTQLTTKVVLIGKWYRRNLIFQFDLIRRSFSRRWCPSSRTCMKEKQSTKSEQVPIGENLYFDFTPFTYTLGKMDDTGADVELEPPNEEEVQRIMVALGLGTSEKQISICYEMSRLPFMYNHLPTQLCAQARVHVPIHMYIARWSSR